MRASTEINLQRTTRQNTPFIRAASRRSPLQLFLPLNNGLVLSRQASVSLPPTVPLYRSPWSVKPSRWSGASSSPIMNQFTWIRRSTEQGNYQLALYPLTTSHQPSPGWKSGWIVLTAGELTRKGHSITELPPVMTLFQGLATWHPGSQNRRQWELSQKVSLDPIDKRNSKNAISLANELIVPGEFSLRI